MNIQSDLFLLNGAVLGVTCVSPPNNKLHPNGSLGAVEVSLQRHDHRIDSLAGALGIPAAMDVHGMEEAPQQQTMEQVLRKVTNLEQFVVNEANARDSEIEKLAGRLGAVEVSPQRHPEARPQDRLLGRCPWHPGSHGCAWHGGSSSAADDGAGGEEGEQHGTSHTQSVLFSVSVLAVVTNNSETHVCIYIYIYIYIYT